MDNNINRHKRKKEPQKVRSALLKAAGQIIVQKGISGLTLDSAAFKAKVSKGGLLHHFPTKQALLNGVFDSVLEHMSAEIKEHMQNDINPYARFTRAYLIVNSNAKKNVNSQLFMILTVGMMSNVALRKRWLSWMSTHLQASGAEENETTQWIIRFAADGFWLSDLTQTPNLSLEQRSAIFQTLIEMTSIK